MLSGFRLSLEDTPVFEELKDRRGLLAAQISLFDLGECGGRLVFPVHDEAGQILGFKIHKGPHLKADGNTAGKGEGIPAQLYPYFHLNADPVWVVEGEPDVWRLATEGVQALTGTAGAGTWKPEWTERLQDHQEVVVAFDHDEAGRKGQGTAVNALRGKVHRLREVVWPAELPAGYDLSDWLNSGHTLEDLPLREVTGTVSGTGSGTASRSRRDEPAPRELVEEALGWLPADEYGAWVEAGMALHHWSRGNEEGLALFDQWSQRAADKYDAKEVRQKWASFGSQGGQALTVATIFQRAQAGGWQGLEAKERTDGRQRGRAMINGHSAVGIVDPSPQVFGELEWPAPQPLPDSLPPVELFEPALLPEAFRPWIEDVAQRLQCPPDFPAVGAMVALAAVVGRQVALRPKVADDWAVVPNLWGAIVGRPGLD
ncbi:MAG: PriCT-2 domain-containing protein [Candidatus Latescibacteria bacterium]|nr:PriCT-2 domain-containing protein [Candidatus Latescibacterota bacterium]